MPNASANSGASIKDLRQSPGVTGEREATAYIQGQNVNSGRVSIAAVMKPTAIIALNLGVLRVVPEMLAASPPSVFAIVMINLLLVQTVALGRPLRAFH
jgi:hypothetical protein